MCLWLLTACLGLLPSNQSPVIVVPAVPSPILVPTAAPTTTTTKATTTTTTTTTTTARPPGNMTMPPVTMPTVTTMSPMPPTNMTTTTTTTPRPTNATRPATPMTSAMPPTSPTPGSLPIDPRLGTTTSSLAAYQVPHVTGYSAQIPSFNDAVRFPREKRDVKFENDMSVKDFFLSIQGGIHHRIRKRETCTCVPKGMCPRTSGAGMIDIRIVTPGASQCTSAQEYCCTDTAPTAAPTVAPTVACGMLQAVPATGVTPAAGQANFGEFPWQALILTKQNDYLAGGVLINQLNVLTVTHRLTSYVVTGTAPNVKVRLGEWDAANVNEPVKHQEYNVAKVFSHPSYNANTLQYDITVLRLASAVPLTPNAGSATTINRACLPASSTTVYNGMRCMVAGWGKNLFGMQGQYQNILKKTDLPVVVPATCQSQLQAARLGSSYVLDTTSFICAGGEANKDACTGDGGSGLMCQVNGQWVVAGLVAWGLGCASANVPGVYVNVAALLPWIQQQVAAA